MGMLLARRPLMMPRPYLGQVATRCYVPTTAIAISAGDVVNSRIYHYARENMYAPRMAVCNWWTRELSSGAGEYANSQTPTIGGAFEYPEGTVVPCKWLGASTIGAGAGANMYSDPTPIFIPRGAKFWSRNDWTATDYFPLVNGDPAENDMTILDPANGDAVNVYSDARSAAGTIADGGFNMWCGPSLILDWTTRPTWGLLGPSRTLGYGDDVSANVGDTGEMARSIGPYFGYLNAGCTSRAADVFLASNGRHLDLLRYCSHMMFDMGASDIILKSHSAATALADTRAVWALFPRHRRYGVTFSPHTTGTWMTTGGQSIPNATDETSRVAFNNAIRAGEPLLDGYIDIADATESGRDSGRWVVTPTPPYTDDGLHLNQGGYLLVKNSGIMRPEMFAVPVWNYRLHGPVVGGI